MSHTQASRLRLSHLAYGGDYNPEQWPETIWEEDVRLMQAAGVNLVSLGIFAWAKLEPRPGEYDFAWLDRVLDLLHAGGIAVDLATATASPPPWLSHQHPDSLPVTADGVRLWPGGRQHYCPSSSAYRAAAQRLVRQLAERYRDHPAVVLWHVGNEYACHVSECFCDESARAFRSWLKNRYTNLDALNAAWGTAFWSQQYGAWEEISPPRKAPTYPNPGQQLDWRRFSSDALLECFDLERSILREITPAIPATTNFLANFKPLNCWTWAAHEDIVSLDSYPDPADPLAHIDAAMNYDLVRSLKGGQPWLLMEQAPSQVNWRAQNLVKRPGQMRLWSHQAVARGAEGVLFFQWRASRAGAEKFHSGMLPHAGTDSRTWREVAALGQELRRLDAVLPTRVQADVAILFDWESWWALELDSKPSQAVRLLDQVHSYYEPLYRRNITVDFVAPDADLSGYRLVLVPNLYLVRDQTAQTLERFVTTGGIVVMSFFSGIVDEFEHIRLGGYPAPFRNLLGLRITELAPYALDQHNILITADGQRFPCTLWSDVIDLAGAEVLAWYGDDWFAHQPALTRQRVGQGEAYYLGTRPNEVGMDWLLTQACQAAGVESAAHVPAGVEAVRCQSADTRLLYVLNHGATAVTITLAEPCTDLLTDRRLIDSLTLEPQAVAVLSS